MWNCQTRERTFHYDLFSSIAGIKDQWDAVLPQGHALRSPELATFESLNPPGLSFLYAMLHFSDGTKGLAWCQIMELETDFIFSDSGISRSTLQISKWLIGSKSRWLVGGHIFRMGFPGFYVQNEQNRGHLIDLLEDIRRKQPLSKKLDALVWKDAESETVRFARQRAGFLVFDGDLTMKLNLDPLWKNWDDYLNALNKKYRQRARKILSKAAELSIRKLESTEVTAYSSLLDELYLNVWQQQEMHATRLPAGYFASQCHVLGENFEVWGFFEHERLVGFSSHIYREGQELEVHYIGMDYAASDRYALYFNILFLGIKTGIEKGKSRVDFGRTSLEAKANTGAEPEEMTHLLLFRRGLNRIGKNLLKQLKERTVEKAIIRNVFKNESEHVELF